MQFRAFGDYRGYRPGKRAARATLLAATALAALCGTVPALAQAPSATQAHEATTRHFDIPVQPLASAVGTFGRQSGLQVTLSSTEAGGIRTNAVVGSFTPAESLARMLNRTGISYRLSGNGSRALIGEQDAAADNGIDNGSTMLETIVVAKSARNASSGSGFQGTPDWVYEEPASVSVVGREAIRNASVRNARELLANTAGVNVSSDNTQNQGINVNMRGLQDQNRVTTMIDGARQNFQRAGHGSTGYAYVDTALIRSVEVDKSGNSGVGGAGGLAGSVNFRTLVADDLIREGETVGGELDATTGSNEYSFAGSAAAAVRMSDDFSLLAAISRKGLGEYAIGENGTIGSGWDTQNLDKPIFTGSESTSGLLKAEMRPTENSTFDLSWLHLQSQFSQGTNQLTDTGALREDTQDITNDTVVGAFGWDPDSELIDLKARFAFNNVENGEHRIKRTAGQEAVDVDYAMWTLGASIENTSRFSLPMGELSLNYGAEIFRDKGDTAVSGDAIALDPLTEHWYSGSNPSGSRTVASVFSNATLEHDDWLMLSGGLRYDYYHLTGTSTIFLKPYTETVSVTTTIPGTCSAIPAPILAFRDSGAPAWTNYVNAQAGLGNTIVGDTLCRPSRDVVTTEDVIRYPTEDVNVDLSDAALLPNAIIAVKPFDGVQIFGKYSETFRPPTIMEAVTGGSHVLAFGPANAPNPYLEAEEGKTYEFGVNYMQDDVFAGGDSVRLKSVAFYREIRNYIALGSIDRTDNGSTVEYASYVNLDGKTRMRGIELEGNYDAGRYYLGGSFTFLDADYADQYTYNGVSHTTGQYIIFTAPRTKMTLDGGLRLFDENLTLGARLTHVEVEKQTVGTMPSLLTAYAADDYTLLDLYGSYKLNDNATLRFAVNNVADVAYLPALGAGILPAPGRTATVSLNFKF